MSAASRRKSGIRRLIRNLLPAIGAAAAAAPSAAACATESGLAVDVRHAPTAIRIGGRTTLVYELHLTSLATQRLRLRALEIIDPGTGTSIGSFRGEAFAAILASVPADSTRPAGWLAPGGIAVAYLWLPLPADQAVPATLRHRVEVSGSDGRVSHSEGGQTPVVRDVRQDLQPPLRGGPWVAAYDPDLARGHRRVLFSIEGRRHIPARFAIDWFRVDAQGRHAAGDVTTVAHWIGYGADVLAVGEGEVVSLRNTVGESPRLATVRRPLTEASGNYVTLALPDGRYVSYEHLQPGSIEVSIGERVRPGQVIARVGYTGDSGGPHLHLHVSDGATPLHGEGLPYTLMHTVRIGAYPSLSEVFRGVPWLPERPATPLEGFPAPNDVLCFEGCSPGP